MNKKQLIRLTEQDIGVIVEEAATTILKQTNKFQLTESSLNRIVGWISNNEIALISAFRGKKEHVVNPERVKNDGKKEKEPYTKKENRERNRELCAALYRLGYGVTKVDGVYIENFGKPSSRISDEASFLVVNQNDDANFYNNIFRLSEFYNQDCFCYKPKNEDVGYNIGTNGADYPGYNNKERNGKFLIGVKNEFMTRLGNKGFTFTDKNPKELEPFDTSHSDRKAERITKRTEKAINEEFAKFGNFSIGAKQTIANIGDTVLNQL